MKSVFGKLNRNDFINGLFWAVIIALATSVLTFTSFAEALENYKAILWTAFSAGLLYIVKSAATNSNGDVLTKESK